jgi:hypothetical protein
MAVAAAADGGRAAAARADAGKMRALVANAVSVASVKTPRRRMQAPSLP